MEIVLLGIILFIMGGAGYVGYVRLSNRLSRVSPLPSSEPAKAVTTGNGHNLKRIWINNNTYSYSSDGWYWSCECGTSGPASERYNNVNGSEEKAMTKWRNHSKLYQNLVGTGTWKDKYDKLKEEHEKYVHDCICKNL